MESAREYLAFRLGAEEYGIDIHAVQELRGYDAVTRIANAPAAFKGVINLRGVIVPIVDMRIHFGVAAPTYDQFTVVVVLNIEDRVVGMVVDSVSDVIGLAPGQIRPAPDMDRSVQAAYLTGIGTVAERMIVLIDIAKMMSGPGLGLPATRAA